MATLFHKRWTSSGTLTEKDTLLVAEFSNSTGDPIFDDSLREALTTQLEQSPYLSLVPVRTVQETLSLMGMAAKTRVNPEIASDLCHRVASRAIVSGSISRIGHEYVIGLNATTCATGEFLAREEARTSNKDDVLKSLESIAIKLRLRLGESLSSIQKFEAPIEQATTPSLEALRAFSLGRKAMNTENWALSVPWVSRPSGSIQILQWPMRCSERLTGISEN
jgi:TolB-like protein